MGGDGRQVSAIFVSGVESASPSIYIGATVHFTILLRLLLLLTSITRVARGAIYESEYECVREGRVEAENTAECEVL